MSNVLIVYLRIKTVKCMNLTAELKGSLDVVCANIRHERGGQVVHDKKANRRRLGTRQTDNSPEKVRRINYKFENFIL